MGCMAISEIDITRCKWRSDGDDDDGMHDANDARSRSEVRCEVGNRCQTSNTGCEAAWHGWDANARCGWPDEADGGLGISGRTREQATRKRGVEGGAEQRTTGGCDKSPPSSSFRGLELRRSHASRL